MNIRLLYPHELVRGMRVYRNLPNHQPTHEFWLMVREIAWDRSRGQYSIHFIVPSRLREYTPMHIHRSPGDRLTVKD